MRKHKGRNLPKGIRIVRGYVFIRIYPDGKVYEKCFGRVEDVNVLSNAISKLNQIREEIRLGKFGLESEAKRATFAQACDLYATLHGNKQKTKRNYTLSLGYLKHYLGSKWLDEITYLDVIGFRKEREKTVKPSSVNRDHTVGTHLFNALKEWKRQNIIENLQLPAENPFAAVKKTSELSCNRKRVVTPDELEIIVEGADEGIKRIILGAINTGLRLKDLRFLTLSGNYNKTINRLEGIQQKTITSRNPSGIRYEIPVTGTVQYLIDTAKGDKLFDMMNFRKRFEETREKAMQRGVSHFEFRDLRRTGATWMYQQSQDLVAVQQQLGHASVAMTERYLNIDNKFQRIAAEAVSTKLLKYAVPSAGNHSKETGAKTGGNEVVNTSEVEAKTVDC